MVKPIKLSKKNGIAIVSLSAGTIGEEFASHQLDLAIKRLNLDFQLNVMIAKNALKGIKVLKENPMLKVEDLNEVFSNVNVKAIICAIGGFDTYKTIPLLLEDENFKNLVLNNPKIFIGYSDSTVNHLMFYRLGLKTFYGHNILCDIAELDKEMLPYTKNSFKWLFDNKTKFEIKPSAYWYEERNDFSKKALNIPREKHINITKYEFLNEKKSFEGYLWGGCIETIYSGLDEEKNKEEAEIFKKYNLILKPNELYDKVLFLETSEEKPSPQLLKKMLLKFKEIGLFRNIQGILIGCPQNHVYYNEYKEVWKEVVPFDIPIIYNVNFGHCYPKTIIAYGAKIKFNSENNKLQYLESIVE